MDRALRVMRYLLAAATIAVCLLLCWQAVDIYLTGNSPENFSAPGVRIAPVYSREIVGSRLAAISPALLAYLALAAGGLVLQAAAGGEPKGRPAVPAEDRLRALRGRAGEVPPPAEAGRLCAAAVILACAVLSGTYLLNARNFSSLDLEAVMGDMVLRVAPWVALALAAGAAASVLNGRSVLREIEILKSAPQKKPEPAPPAGKRSPLPVVRAVLCAAAVGLIALGAANGGLWDVLVKAVNICTECIGLG